MLAVRMETLADSVLEKDLAPQPGFVEHLLAPGQETLLAQAHLAPTSTALHLSAAARMSSRDGALDLAVLARGWRQLAARHPALRTTFPAAAVPCQRVHAELAPVFELEEVTELSERALAERMNAAARRPFDLERGPLARLHVFCRARGETLVVFVFHHLVADLWSLAVAARDLGALYDGSTELPPLALEDGFWVRERRARLAGPQGEMLRGWWRARLAGKPGVLELPSDRPRSVRRGLGGAAVARQVGSALAGRLPALARTAGATLFATLLAVWQTLLHRWSGQDELLVGAPVAGRRDGRLRDVVGYLVEMVVVDGCFAGDPRFSDHLTATRAAAAGALAHQGVPPARLAEELGHTLEPGRSPLFQAVFVLQSAIPLGRGAHRERLALGGLILGHSGTRLGTGSLVLEPLPLAAQGAQFDLTLTAAEVDDGLALSLLYATDLFDPPTLERMAEHYVNLLRAVVDDPERRVWDLPLLAPAEQAQLRGWGGARGAREVAATLAGRFAAQVARTPEAVALLGWNRAEEPEQLSYGALAARAGRVARRLRALGVGPETRVGVAFERTPELVIAILGVLAAGGAYVPLDPAHPAERLGFQLADAGAAVLLTHTALRERLPAGEIPVLELDGLELDGLELVDSDSVFEEAAPDNAAYLIYTSGSTGRPKGVVVSHRNAVRLFDATREDFGFGADDVWTLFHAAAFDFSVWEIWGALLHGGRLVVVPWALSRSPEDFHRLLANERVSVLSQTPSAFRQLIETDGRAVDRLAALRQVVFGGERLELPALSPWLERYGDEHPRLVNMYGITETTVHVTRRRITAADLGHASPIGVPLGDLSLHVLDRRGRPVPIGVVGEIHVGGAGLARGYHDRPALSAERFVPDPWADVPGARLYRSGDLARWRPTSDPARGDLEFLGRRDHQVKIRGFRIELGEIETALAAHPGVRAAVVLARAEPQRLIAWWVAQGEPAPSAETLHRFLAERLPAHMLPQALVRIAALPLTVNGKLDRGALPDPGAERPALATPWAAPATATERVLAEVWAEILGVERVGRDDNYFVLGGDSIRSIGVVSRARERGVELAFEDLFRFPTVRELARRARFEPVEVARASPPEGEPSGSQLPPAEAGSGAPFTGRKLVARRFTAGRHGTDAPLEPFALVRAEDRPRLPAGLDDAWPLTRVLSGMVYHAESSPDYEIYVTSVHLGLPCDLRALGAAAQEMVTRHAILRTSFDLAGASEPLQWVHRGAEIPIAVCDLRRLAPAAQERELGGWIRAELHRRFDWGRPPLVRLTVHRRSATTLQLSLSEPFFDGWSVASFLTELVRRYRARLAGNPLAEPPLRCSVSDFVALEQAALASTATRDFWRHALEDAVPSRLPSWPVAASAGLTVERLTVERLEIPVPSELAAAVRALAARLAVPLKSVLLSAHLAVVALATGERDVVSGLMVNGRPETTDGERVLGLFLSAVPLRQRLRGQSWRALVAEVFAAENALLPHRRLPLAEILRPRGGEPLFDTVFNFTHFHAYGELEKLGVEVLGGFASEQTYYDLTVQWNVDHASGALRLALDHRPRHLAQGRAAALGAAFLRVLEVMIADPNAPENRTALLGAAERRLVVETWNHTERRWPEGDLATLFHTQAERTPDAAAVSFGEQTLSYGELARRVERAAHGLRALGVGSEGLVALFLERSPEMLIAILAIAGAGGAWLPLDLGYPAERQRQVLGTARPMLVIARRGAATPTALRPVWIEELMAAGLPAQPALPAADPDQLAYTIFTSGSTGTPKGAMVVGRGMLNHLWLKIHDLGLGATDVVLQNASQCFDVSVWQFLAALLVGGRVHVVDDAAAGDPRLLLTEIERARVSVLETVPSLLRVLLDEPALPAALPLRWLVPTGEALPPELCRRWLARYPRVPLTNAYGPTECSDDVTHAVIDRPPAAGETAVPIGRAVANTRLYVLDSGFHPAFPGAPGELCVAGAGVGRGYLGAPARTAAVFVPDPFATAPGERLYRTGDLARHLPGGELVFLGRRDHQVKIRGFRIELGEIETALAALPGVAQAAVLDREHGGSAQLVAWVVPRHGAAPTAAELREALRRKLPAYMVPTAWALVEALPLTPNGKLDRQALRRAEPPADEPAENSRAAMAPRSATEEILAAIWADVLGLDRVGIDEDFYALGGHSLLATQVVARIRRALDVELPLATLLESATIARLAPELERARRGETLPALIPAPRDGELPLSFAQQRLLFLDRLAPGDPVYNLPGAVRLRGQLDVAALAASVEEVVRRHEALRTTFLTAGGRSSQQIRPPHSVPLPVVDLSGLPAAARATATRRVTACETARPFDLATGPLLRTLLIALGEQDRLLVLSLHHVASDGWGQGVFVAELARLYDAFRAGLPSPLAPLPLQYADFALWQRRWLGGERLDRQAAYWRTALAGLPVLALPTDRPRPPVLGTRGGVVRARWGAELLRPVAALARREGATLFMVLFAAFEVLLHHLTGQDDLAIGTDVANRRLGETEGLVGFFVNQLVLRGDVAGDPSFCGLVARARRLTLDAWTHQDLPFEQLVEILDPPRERNRTPLFQVKLVLQNAPRPPLVAGGLALEIAELETGTAKFDLLWNLWEAEGELRLALEHNTELFTPATAERLAALYRATLERVAAEPERRLSGLRADLAAAEEAWRRERAERWRGARAAIKTLQAKTKQAKTETIWRGEQRR